MFVCGLVYVATVVWDEWRWPNKYLLTICTLLTSSIPITTMSQLYLDSVDTPTAISHMKDLVRETNVYVGEHRHNDKLPNQTLIRNIAVYLTDMLQVRNSLHL